MRSKGSTAGIDSSHCPLLCVEKKKSVNYQKSHEPFIVNILPFCFSDSSVVCPLMAPLTLLHLYETPSACNAPCSHPVPGTAQPGGLLPLLATSG